MKQLMLFKSAIVTTTQGSLRQKPLHGRYWQPSDGVLDMPLSFLKSATLRPSAKSSGPESAKTRLRVKFHKNDFFPFSASTGHGRSGDKILQVWVDS